tara:strand:- start:340 stop:549 length:210 start_codon:yes stop_codon:yes gene_type:complete
MYQSSEKSQQLLERLNAFFDEYIYPNEENYARQIDGSTNRFATMPLMDELKLKGQGRWPVESFCTAIPC